jgi:hypothetical protein
MAALLCALCLTVVALAADKPDFSGSWKLNVEKSDFGPSAKPERADITIKHVDPELNVSSKAVLTTGEVVSELKLFTDGREFTNLMSGQELKGTAKWDGRTLILTQKISVQGADISVTQKWTLAEDGKSLLQNVAISVPQGEIRQKFVLEK